MIYRQNTNGTYADTHETFNPVAPSVVLHRLVSSTLAYSVKSHIWYVYNCHTLEWLQLTATLYLTSSK